MGFKFDQFHQMFDDQIALQFFAFLFCQLAIMINMNKNCRIRIPVEEAFVYRESFLFLYLKGWRRKDHLSISCSSDEENCACFYKEGKKTPQQYKENDERETFFCQGSQSLLGVSPSKRLWRE
jgi:hypothetical protein